MSYSPTFPRQPDGSIKIGPLGAGQTAQLTFNMMATSAGTVSGRVSFYEKSGDSDVAIYYQNGNTQEFFVQFQTAVKWRD